MNRIIAQQVSILTTSVKVVVSDIVLQLLGIQTTLLVLPVCTGDKRFNQ